MVVSSLFSKIWYHVLSILRHGQVVWGYYLMLHVSFPFNYKMHEAGYTISRPHLHHGTSKTTKELTLCSVFLLHPVPSLEYLIVWSGVV